MFHRSNFYEDGNFISNKMKRNDLATTKICQKLKNAEKYIAVNWLNSIFYNHNNDKFHLGSEIKPFAS